MSVVNSIEDVGPWRKKLQIEIPASDVDSETTKVVRHYSRQVRLPGFRKGKVPASIVQQRFRAEIEHEVAERLVPVFWQKAREESELDPMLPPSVGELEIKEGEPLVFEATVEVRPEIEIGDLDGFDLPEGEAEPTDEEVGEAIERLREQVADWQDVERAASRGDRVALEVTELDDDEEPKGDAQPLQVEVGGDQVWEELSLAVSGLEAGQETDFRRQEEHGDHSHVRHFAVKVSSVQERDLPPLDDELGKMIGDFETLDALRSDLSERLQQEKEHAIRSTREQAVMEQLRERYPVDLPKGVVEEETRELLREYAQNLARQGIDVEKVEIDWNKMGDDAKPQAELRVHSRLLLDAVVAHQELEVDGSVVDQRVALLARAQNKNVAAVRREMTRDGQLEALEQQLRRERALDRLLGVADEEEVGESSADESTETSLETDSVETDSVETEGDD